MVLEPTEPLASARLVLYAGMAALAEALAACAPPETAIHIEWPDALYVNWGLVGGGRLAWPDKAKENELFGAIIRTATAAGVEPGLAPDVTALDEEGFTEFTSGRVIEGFARSFMQSLNAWQESGFATVTKSYFERLSRESGQQYEIVDNGDLVVRIATGKAERTALLPRLAEPAWLAVTSKISL